MALGTEPLATVPLASRLAVAAAGGLNVLVQPLAKTLQWPLVLALPQPLNEDND